MEPGEWLETDGRGGFASGGADGIRTRRYHALLLSATRPPTGRMALVNGIEAWARTGVGAGDAPLSSQRYSPDVVYPDARASIADFVAAPWPRWTFRLPDGSAIEHDVLVVPCGETILRWRRVAGRGACALSVRPLLSGRDYHALHHENPVFDFAHAVVGDAVVWRPYPGVPSISAVTNGAYRAAPEWYRRFLYVAEQERGLDCIEDLASPGVFVWDLAMGDAVMRLRAGEGQGRERRGAEQQAPDAVLEAERMRRAGLPEMERAALAYVVARRGGRTVIAGYPWFADWGRDTFIAMRGLLLAMGRIAEAGEILHGWAGHLSEGMLPNRFPEGEETPEYNSVDASLWFVIAVHEYLEAAGNDVAGAGLRDAVRAILGGYTAGTRYGIAADADGLLRAGVPGMQLTWMDAKVGERVVTPRVGKPVEVQALWINALHIGAAWDARFGTMERAARAAFAARFPDPVSSGLYDVVDCDGVAGAVDGRVRPNQIFAVGGLPFPLLSGTAARLVVDLVERRLLTPLGLRTLAPDDPDYVGRYTGGPSQRDGAYHQGTAWPWLMGPFVEAWLRTGAGSCAMAEARFVAPLRAHLQQAGLGHVSEVADGDAPHRPGGCPFQAWSLGELLRIERMLRTPPLEVVSGGGADGWA